MKTERVNKSEAVRAILAENLEAKPTDVIAELKKRKINVTSGYVSSIRSLMRQKRNVIKPTSQRGRKKARRHQPKAKKQQAARAYALRDMQAARLFLRSVPDPKNAKELVDAVTSLQLA